jgi:hypothetical protein
MWWWNWHWQGWGYGFGVTLGALALLAVVVVPVFLFLLNLRDLLDRVGERNRAMPSTQVWLNFIPVFGIGWFIYTVTKVRDSVQAEFRSRGWPVTDDQGYSVGLATGVGGAAMFVLGWVPFFGWLIGLACLACWIIYWVKTAAIRDQLGRGVAPSGPRPTPRASPHGTGGVTSVDGDAPNPEVGDGSTTRCPGCGSAYDAGDTFCRSCGRRL